MVSIKNLDYGYQKSSLLFKSLDLTLQSGKVYGLLGKNGMGKSTLLKLIVGALNPLQGEVIIGNEISFNRSAQSLADIFLLKEELEIPGIAINQFIAAKAGFYPKFDISKFENLLSIFEVEKNSSLGAMSLGQKKKVIIAFALACNTSYLLMDEPTNGLDIPSKGQFRKALARHVQANQVVIISTHQIRDLSNCLDSIIILENGQIIFNQDIFEIEQRLLFTNSNDPSNPSGSIYSEIIPGGYMHISSNEANLPSQIELEVLFNAITTQKDNILKVFK